jgi:acyl dehydratase
MPERLYFEDLEVGVEYRSTGRTITVADIVNFAGVSGDFAELHMSDDIRRPEGDEGESAPLYPGRIAHGLLGLIVHSRQGGEAAPTAGLAFLGIDKWRFRLPILPGDTLYARLHVKEKRLSASHPGAGVVTWHREVLNQKDEVVQDGEMTLLVGCREPA